jgi:hypothetical protein
MKKLPLSITLLGLLGCGPTLKFTGIGEAREPKPPTCPITLLKAAPAAPYEELGTIDILYDNTGFLSKQEELKRKLQPEVCRVGGDAALGIANSYGTYIQAKVYSAKTQQPKAKPMADGGAETSGSEAPDGAAELGKL